MKTTIIPVTATWTHDRVRLNGPDQIETAPFEALEGETLVDVVNRWTVANPSWRWIGAAALPAPYRNEYAWEVLADCVYSREAGEFLFLTLGQPAGAHGGPICESCHERLTFADDAEVVIYDHAWCVCLDCESNMLDFAGLVWETIEARYPETAPEPAPNFKNDLEPLPLSERGID